MKWALESRHVAELGEQSGDELVEELNIPLTWKASAWKWGEQACCRPVRGKIHVLPSPSGGSGVGAQASWNDKFFACCGDVNSDLTIPTWGSGLLLAMFPGWKSKSHLLLVWSLIACWKDQISLAIGEDPWGWTGREVKRERKKATLPHPVPIWSVTLCQGSSHWGAERMFSLPNAGHPAIVLASVAEASRCKPESCQVERVPCGTAEGTMEMKVTWACQLQLQRAHTKVTSHGMFPCHCRVLSGIWEAWVLTSQKRRRKKDVLPSESTRSSWSNSRKCPPPFFPKKMVVKENLGHLC